MRALAYCLILWLLLDYSAFALRIKNPWRRAEAIVFIIVAAVASAWLVKQQTRK